MKIKAEHCFEAANNLEQLLDLVKSIQDAPVQKDKRADRFNKIVEDLDSTTDSFRLSFVEITMHVDSFESNLIKIAAQIKDIHKQIRAEKLLASCVVPGP